jgi:hypothetical protein
VISGQWPVVRKIGSGSGGVKTSAIAITKLVSGVLVTILSIPALYTRLLFGYAEQDAAVRNFFLPSEIAALVFLAACLHCGLFTFWGGVRQLRGEHSKAVVSG